MKNSDKEGLLRLVTMELAEHGSPRHLRDDFNASSGADSMYMIWPCGHGVHGKGFHFCTQRMCFRWSFAWCAMTHALDQDSNTCAVAFGFRSIALPEADARTQRHGLIDKKLH